MSESALPQGIPDVFAPSAGLFLWSYEGQVPGRIAIRDDLCASAQDHAVLLPGRTHSRPHAPSEDARGKCAHGRGFRGRANELFEESEVAHAPGALSTEQLGEEQLRRLAYEAPSVAVPKIPKRKREQL